MAEVAELASSLWQIDAAWHNPGGDHPHEAELLALDAGKARRELGWHDRLTYTDAVAWTIDWHQRVISGADPRDVTVDQVREYRLRDGH